MKTGVIVLTFSALAVAGCTQGYQTGYPSTNYQSQRKAECVTGVLGGAVVGGLLGNTVGGGTGKKAATAVGAGAGAAAGSRLPACQ